jgi:hypothetical protein
LPTNTTWAFSLPKFVLLNVAVGGDWPGNPDATIVFPQQMLVDYVRIYAPTNLPSCGANGLANPGFELGGLANWTTYGAGFNTVLENIRDLPVHDGSNVFKVFGQFDGIDNYSGVFQDLPTGPGKSFAASGWALTPSNDVIAGSNTAWIEVSFRDAATNILALNRSPLITSNTAPGGWMEFSVTNQIDPVTFATIGSSAQLLSPTNTSFVRYQLVFHQPATAAGSVLFDDLKLTSWLLPAYGAPLSPVRTGNNLSLAFSTYLGWPYQLRWKNLLSDPSWSLQTNLTGTGGIESVSVDLLSVTRFYSLVRLCND